MWKNNPCVFVITVQVLKTDKDKEEAKHEEEIADLLEKHGKELQDLESANNQKLMSEYEKYQELQAKSQKMQEDYERQLTEMEESKEQALEESTEYYENKLTEKSAQLEQVSNRLRLVLFIKDSWARESRSRARKSPLARGLLSSTLRKHSPCYWHSINYFIRVYFFFLLEMFSRSCLSCMHKCDCRSFKNSFFRISNIRLSVISLPRRFHINGWSLIFDFHFSDSHKMNLGSSYENTRKQRNRSKKMQTAKSWT